MKKFLAILLCLVIAVSLFAGCNKDGDNKGGTAGNNGEKVTLEIGVKSDANITSFEDNAYTKWLEEQTGYDLTFYEFPATTADAKSVLGTMVVDGEMPDIIWNISLNEATRNDYGEDGYFIDLQDYFADKEGASKTFWERFALLSEEDQELNLRKMTNPETGAIYGVPHIETSLVDTMNYQAWINQTWLDELGLEAPTDPTSLRNVLQAFKDAKGDSCIPMIAYNGKMGANVVNWITNMFTHCDNNRMFSVGSDGKLYLPQTTDAYREALIYINQLRKDGLLSELTWTIASNAEIKSILAQTPTQVGVFVGHLTLSMNEGAETLFDYAPLDCYGYALLTDNNRSLSTYITESCENPDAAFNLMMVMTSEEGSLRMRYGEYGTNWTYADPGTKSGLGLDAEIKVLNDPWGTQNNVIWGQIHSTILLYAEGEVNQADEASATEWQLYKNKLVAEQVENFYAANEANDKSVICPTLVYTEEEEEYKKQYSSDCNDVISTYRGYFTTGKKDPTSDADWKEYLDKLDELGVQKWIEIAQTVYERQLKEGV